LTPPSVTSTQSHLTPHRDKVTVNASVRDASGVRSVDLLYRPMPSFYAWQSVPMRKVGTDRYKAAAPLTPEGLLYRIVAVDKKGVSAQWPSFLKETPYRCIAPWEPSWVTHRSVALREGTPTYAPRIGEKVFADGEGVIKAIPEELTGLTGVRYPERALVRAQAHGYGGFPIPFKVLKETRLFLAFRGDPFPGYGRYAPKALTVGDKQYDIFARDFTLGEHLLVFPRGPIGIVLGFKERTPKDKPLEVPSVRLGGKLVWEVLKRDFVTTSTDFEFYMPKVGALVYTDRQYAIERIPEELQQCLGLRFSNDRAKQGNMSVPFKLEKPAMLYVVFGNADEGAWQRPPRDWKLYAKDAYRHGPTDTLQRSIYCKNNPAGDGVLTLESGTGVILGFK
ncbi:MAG: hypothetical protein HY318_18850, partial [Armatimonadetes bacterium]|nr:hypothetical protein [Armatimonadota bacterium]